MRRRLPVPSDRALRVLLWMVAIAVVLSVMATIVTGAQFAGRLDAYSQRADLADQQRASIEADNDAQARAIEAQQRALKEVNRRCRDAAGCTPVATPPVVITGDPGAAGPTGPTGVTGPRGPGPSAAQVAVAVASYCASGVCNGPGPTTDQVAAAVVTYCDRNGQCRGPEGTAGTKGNDGTSGKDGTQGERGPGPTAEQVASAVADYCTDGRCVGATGAVGPTGATGDAGAAGAPGRGIDSVTCDASLPVSFTITYSDGASTEVSCGLTN